MPDEPSKTERTEIGRRSTAITGRYDGPTGSRRALLESVAAAPAALSIGLTGTVGSVAAQDGPDDVARTTANVVLRDQSTDGRIVVAESVRLPNGGYVGIHDEQLFSGDI